MMGRAKRSQSWPEAMHVLAFSSIGFDLELLARSTCCASRRYLLDLGEWSPANRTDRKHEELKAKS